MIRDFSREELAPAANETELTLGVGAFLAIGVGLLFLCAICFGLGYMVGHRSSPDQNATAEMPVPDARAAVTPTGSGGVKPGASTQAAQPQGQGAMDSQTDGNGTAAAQDAQAGSAANLSQAEVKPVEGSGVRSAPAGQASTSKVQGWMVQIAAVSRSEDAQVLVDALRKRGYEVTARRDVGDSLIHVQTGPFVNRNDANAMRQKLLSDGYNAIVQ